MHGYHRGEHGMLEKNLFIISNAFVLLFHMGLSVSASRISSLEVQSLRCILLFLFSFLFSLYLKRPVVSSLETPSTSASLFSFFFFNFFIMKLYLVFFFFFLSLLLVVGLAVSSFFIFFSFTSSSWP